MSPNALLQERQTGGDAVRALHGSRAETCLHPARVVPSSPVASTASSSRKSWGNILLKGAKGITNEHAPVTVSGAVPTLLGHRGDFTET